MDQILLLYLGRFNYDGFIIVSTFKFVYVFYAQIILRIASGYICIIGSSQEKYNI